MPVIEAQCASILVPHDHRHINHERSSGTVRPAQDLSAGTAIAAAVRGGSWVTVARSDYGQLEGSYSRCRHTLGNRRSRSLWQTVSTDGVSRLSAAVRPSAAPVFVCWLSRTSSAGSHKRIKP